MTLAQANETPVKGVRVGFDTRWTDEPDQVGMVAYRDHARGTHWVVTKQGQLIVKDRRKKTIARYRQFVWREVTLA